MPLPRYRAEMFIDSGWPSGTAERKARFLNMLLRFIADDYARERFTEPLYQAVSNHGYFGFIAHYDIHGFYDEELSAPERRSRFLGDLIEACEHDAGTVRPDLWTDVKAVLLRQLRPSSPWAELSPVEVFGVAAPTRSDAPTLF